MSSLLFVSSAVKPSISFVSILFIPLAFTVHINHLSLPLPDCSYQALTSPPFKESSRRAAGLTYHQLGQNTNAWERSETSQSLFWIIVKYLPLCPLLWAGPAPGVAMNQRSMPLIELHPFWVVLCCKYCRLHITPDHGRTSSLPRHRVVDKSSRVGEPQAR